MSGSWELKGNSLHLWQSLKQVCLIFWLNSSSSQHFIIRQLLNHQAIAESSVWLNMCCAYDSYAKSHNWCVHNFLHVKMWIHTWYHAISHLAVWHGFLGPQTLGFPTAPSQPSFPLGHGPATEITNIQKIAEREEWSEMGKGDEHREGGYQRSCLVSNSLVPKTVVVLVPANYLSTVIFCR